MEFFLSFFITICNAGYQASIAIGVLLLVRYILGRLKFPRRYICLLWGIPFLRLLLPGFRFRSILSLMPKHYEPVPQNIMSMPQPGVSTGLPYIDQSVNRFLASPGMVETADPAAAARMAETGSPVQWLMLTLASIWAAGMVLYALYGLVSLLHLKQRIRTAVSWDKSRDDSCGFTDSKSAGWTAGNIPSIYLADDIPTAFVLGLFRPCIYIPANLSPETVEPVVRHEKTHIRRRDHLVKIMAFALLGIYWFHPPVWIAFFFLNRDLEYACDETVVEGQDTEYRKRYSAALLALSTDRRWPAVFPLAFSEGNLKSRIRNIAACRKPVLWVSILAFALAGTLGISLLASPEEEKQAETAAGMTEPAVRVETEEKEQIRDEENVSLPLKLTGLTGEEAAEAYMPVFRAYLECPNESYFAWVEEAAAEMSKVIQGENEPGGKIRHDSEDVLAYQSSWEDQDPGWKKLFTENGYKEFFTSYRNGFHTYQNIVHDIGAVTKIQDLQLSARDIGYNWTCTVRLIEDPADPEVYTDYTLEGLIRTAEDGRVDYFERKTEQGLSARLGNRLQEMVREQINISADGPTAILTIPQESGEGREANEEIPLTPPAVDLAAPYGADPVELLYADEGEIVFAGYFGLFVYSKEENRIIRAVDLAAIGCQFTQGDAACEKMISYNGEKVLLHPMNAEYLYIYDIPANRLQKSPGLDLLDSVNFTSHTVQSPGGDGTYAYDVWQDSDGILHATYISELWTDIGRMYWFDNMPDDGLSDTIMRPLFPPQGYEEAVPFHDPGEVHDLTEIAMRIKGEMRTTTDPEVLRRVEELFSEAEWQKDGSGCPVYDCMYFTRKDGVTGFLNPATDSCNMLRMSDGWVRYRTDSGSSEEFWTLFDGWLEALWAQ